jgi:dinuclear metal center YbgI/SA1388 family protein
VEPTLDSLVNYVNGRLHVREMGDYAHALNGLQLENDGAVTRIGAAVDASLSTVTEAVESGCTLLLVHHGLFWNGLQPMTGNRRKLFKTALDGNLAIYSAHLPLDTSFHGNSYLLAEKCFDRVSLAFEWRPFFEAKGTMIGWRGRLDVPLDREALAAKLSKAVGGGPVRICPGGPELSRHIGVVTGAAGSEVRRVAEEGIDALITGEGPHWTYTLAEEVSVNIFYGGHYATETFGVKKLAEDLGKQYNLPWEFIDCPTGL